MISSTANRGARSNPVDCEEAGACGVRVAVRIMLEAYVNRKRVVTASRKRTAAMLRVHHRKNADRALASTSPIIACRLHVTQRQEIMTRALHVWMPE